MRKRTAILISGRGSNMAALIEAAKTPDFPAGIALVVSNRPEAGGLVHAQAAGIATRVIDHKPFGNDRWAFDAELQKALEDAAIDIICLAGFMRLLTTPFVEAWSGRMINVHPALLPSFKGLDTHARALAAGVKLHGCTTHFVSPLMDEGAIIMQAAVPVYDGDDASTLAARVLVEEHRIFPRTLRLLAEGQLRIENGRVFGAD